MRPLPPCLLVCLALVLTPLSLAAQQASGSQPRETVRLIVLSAETPLTPAQLADFDVVDAAADRLTATVIAWDWDMAQIEARGLTHHIIEADLEAFYAARLSTAEELAEQSASLGGATTLTPAFGQGSMGGYYTYAEVVSVLDQLTAQHPTLISAKQSIGQSIEGRDLWAVKLSDNPGVDEDEPEVRFDSLHHAREPEGMQAVIYFMVWALDNYGSDPLATYLLDEREIWCIPVVNPDGYEYNRQTNPNGGGLWRKNRRDNQGSPFFGVDLNRNYPFQWGYDNFGSSGSTSSDLYRGTSAGSEPETQAMLAFMAAHDFGSALSIHCWQDKWLAPFGYDAVLPANNDDYDEVGALATESNGYEYGPGSIVLYPANGGTIDTDHGVHGTMSWTPEIGGPSDGFWPSSNKIIPLALENLEGLQRTALAGGPYLRATGVSFVDEGDGDGVFEPGETVAVVVTARNSGTGATSSASASLSSASAGITLVTSSVPLGAWAGFDDADNSTMPLRFVVDGNIPTGTSVSIRAGVGEHGFFDGLTTNFVVDNDWATTGSGLAGVNGVPALSAQGALIGQSAGALNLVSAAPSAQAYLVIGLAALNASFKGGVLIPQPDLVFGPLPTTGAGTLSLPYTWPHSVAGGTQLWVQYWIQDAAGPVGFAASNGLVGTAQ